MTPTPDTPPSATTTSIALRRWPTWAAVGMAALTAFDLARGTDLAPILVASAIIYLGAATSRKPSAAWLLFLGTVVAIFVARLVRADVDATWILLGIAVPVLIHNLWSGAARAHDRLLHQMIAMVGFGAVAALALGAGTTGGGYLVAGGLLGHAAWDARHHRADAVVTRPFAEFCLVLDVLLAAAIVVVTLRG